MEELDAIAEPASATADSPQAHVILFPEPLSMDLA